MAFIVAASAVFLGWWKGYGVIRHFPESNGESLDNRSSFHCLWKQTCANCRRLNFLIPIPQRDYKRCNQGAEHRARAEERERGVESADV